MHDATDTNSAPAARANSIAAKPFTRPTSPHAISAVITDAAMPKYGIHRMCRNASATIATGAMNGTIMMTGKRGDASGPNHHVESPIFHELFQTAANDSTTPIHISTVSARHPKVSSPSTGMCSHGGNVSWVWGSVAGG